ncbi:MAG: glycosyltransferase family 2 protein [Bacteroidia bacterium]
MRTLETTLDTPVQQLNQETGSTPTPALLPLLTLITPAYNEQAIIEESIQRLCTYMKGLESRYRWEILIVNDGSADKTGALADQLAATFAQVRVVHHKVNRNLGQALQTGFRHAKGDYVIVLDLDLSYGPDHIERLMDEIAETDADVVIASPYMKGGKVTAVPFGRLLLSRVVNRIMRSASARDIYTFTSMVRVYKGEFLRYLNLKSSTYDVNPEIIHKAIILRARIREIPAHLDWSFQKTVGKGRTSSIRIVKGIFAGLMSGFIFRPYMYFMIMGLLLMVPALYMIGWTFIHTFEMMGVLEQSSLYNTLFSQAVAEAFRQRPHTFLVGGICLIVSLQFLGIGFLSLQSKRYFDELFHLNTTINRKINSFE